ncbi:MAG: DMT family transporter [Holosporaceae bacterium]|jgi:drug/metabolite transporter (DMT)-like permease|nr:DMT family transporter [Holosporaceae bacterium]
MNFLANSSFGYLFFICGVCLYAVSDAIMKYFMPVYDVNQVIFMRTLARFVPLLGVMFSKRKNPFKTEKMSENLFRAVLASLGTYAFMCAYGHANMTDVVVVSYTSAVFVIPFSIMILKEKFNVQNAMAILCSFFGVLLAFRPGNGVFQYGIIFAIIGAMISAINLVLIRKLSYTEDEITIMFYHQSVLLVMSFVIGASTFHMANHADMIILLLGGIVGAIAQYCIIHALKLSTSSGLAAASYAMLVPVTIIDYYLYNKTPDCYIVGGLLLILMGNLKAFSIQSQLK